MVEYVYDAYGVPTVSFPGITEGMTDAEKQAIYLLGNNNPFRYRGYYFDVESGLYYLNSRYYDPVTGRFLNADNDYSDNNFDYCDNNSINLISSSGKGPSYIHEFVVPELKIMIAVVGMVVEKNTTSSKLTINSGLSTKDNFRDVTDEVNTILFATAAEARQLRDLLYKPILFSSVTADFCIYMKFFFMVNHNEEWDIKYKDPWVNTIGTDYPGRSSVVVYEGMEITLEDLGNYTYGYLGAAFGIPIDILLTGSYIAAGAPLKGSELKHEREVDWVYIKMGYKQYYLNN